MTQITEHGPQLSENDIATLEGAIGIRLPHKYRQFLLSNNGGRPDPDIVDIDGLPGTPTDIKIFFGIGRQYQSSEISWNLQLIQERCPLKRVLPIASDSGGNLFCLAIAADASSLPIVYCDLESPTFTFYDVAPSFEEFMGTIRRWE